MEAWPLFRGSHWSPATCPILSRSRGTLAEVNLALASVHYLGNPNFNGSDTLTVTTSDGAAERHRHRRDHGQRRSHDAPVLDLDADNSSGATRIRLSSPTFTEDGSPVALTATLTVTMRHPNVTPARPCVSAQTASVVWSMPRERGRDATLALDRPRLHRQPRLQRLRHAAPVDDVGSVTLTRHRRPCAITRSDPVNDAPVNTVPGAADRQRGHAAARSPACRSPTRTVRRSPRR